MYTWKPPLCQVIGLHVHTYVCVNLLTYTVHILCMSVCACMVRVLVLVLFKVTGLEQNVLGVIRGIPVLVVSTATNLPQRRQHSPERTGNTLEALWQLSFCKILVHTKICVDGVVSDIATTCFTWYFTGGVNCGKQIACVHKYVHTHIVFVYVRICYLQPVYCLRAHLPLYIFYAYVRVYVRT